MPKITIGEIASEKVDVIVNTSNTSLDLRIGNVSKSLLKVGGNDIQKECEKALQKRSFFNRFSDGQFEVTSGGQLKCQKIYHCCLGTFNVNHSEQQLVKCITDMLETADKQSMMSMAIPALGTGNLGYPRDRVAKCMYETVDAFWKKYPQTRLTDIRFVLYGMDTPTIKAFQDLEAKLGSSAAPMGASGATPGGAVAATGRSQYGQSGGRLYPVIPGQPKTFSPVTLRVKNLQVMVMIGDIANHRVEAVVNPIGTSMNIRIGGGELSKQGVVCVQMSKGLTVVNVDRALVMKNQREAIMACLRRASSAKVKTIAFPILKTGDAARELADDIHHALPMYLEQHPVTSLDEVHVVIYQQQQFETFTSRLTQLCQGNDEPSRLTHKTSTQITFVIISDDRSNIEKAKHSLKQFSEEKVITTNVNLPQGITKDDLKYTGLKHEDVNTKMSEDRSHVELRGKPEAVLKAVADFEDAFEKLKERPGFRGKQTMNYGRQNVALDSFLKTNYLHMDQENKLIETSPQDVKNSQTSFVSQKSMNFVLEEGNRHKEHSVKHRGTPEYHQSLDSARYHHQLSCTSNERTSQNKLFGKGETSWSDSKSSAGRSVPAHDDGDAVGSLSSKEDRQGSHRGDADPRQRPVPTHEEGQERSSEPTRMRWFYEDNGKLEPYENELSEDIEKAYLQGKGQHKFEVCGQQFQIDLVKMIECSVENHSDRVSVFRRENLHDVSDDEAKVEFSGLDKEVKSNIMEKIIKSCPSLTILKMEKVSNTQVLQRFNAKRESMKQECEQSDAGDMLWHGCKTTDSVMSVISHGLNRGNCTHPDNEDLGEGIYLTSEFKDSINVGSTDRQYVYFCRVLTGNQVKGFQSKRRLGCDSSGKVYHSVKDSFRSSKRVVVFSDAQVYPEYLITFKLDN